MIEKEPVIWEYIADAEEIQQLESFKLNLALSPNDVQDYLNKTVLDWKRANFFIYNVSIRDRLNTVLDIEAPKKLIYFLQSLKANKELTYFLRLFCHQNGFIFVGINSILKSCANNKYFISSNNIHGKYYLKRAEDGSIDFTAKHKIDGFQKINENKVSDIIETKEKSEILTVTTRLNIAYDQEKGIIITVKQYRLTAHHALANTLLPDKAPANWFHQWLRSLRNFFLNAFKKPTLIGGFPEIKQAITSINHQKQQTINEKSKPTAINLKQDFRLSELYLNNTIFGGSIAVDAEPGIAPEPPPLSPTPSP